MKSRFESFANQQPCSQVVKDALENNRLQFCMWRNIMDVNDWYAQNKEIIETPSNKSKSRSAKIGCGVFVDEFMQ